MPMCSQGLESETHQLLQVLVSPTVLVRPLFTNRSRKEVRQMKRMRILGIFAWPLIIFGVAFAAYLASHSSNELAGISGLGRDMGGSPVGDGTGHNPP